MHLIPGQEVGNMPTENIKHPAIDDGLYQKPKNASDNAKHSHEEENTTDTIPKMPPKHHETNQNHKTTLNQSQNRRENPNDYPFIPYFRPSIFCGPRLLFFSACRFIGLRDIFCSLLSLSLIVFWAGWQIYINTKNSGKVDILFTTAGYRAIWFEVVGLLIVVFTSEFLVALAWMQNKRRQYLRNWDSIRKYMLPYLVGLPVCFIFDTLGKIFGYRLLTGRENIGKN